MEARRQLIYDFFSRKNIELHQKMNYGDMKQVLVSSSTRSDYESMIFDQLWDRMQKQQYVGELCSSPYEFTIVQLEAEQILQQRINEKKNANQYNDNNANNFGVQTELEECVNDLALLCEPFNNQNHKEPHQHTQQSLQNIKPIHSQSQLQYGNLNDMKKNQEMSVNILDNSESRMKKNSSKSSRYLVIMLLVWLVFNMFVNFGRTVFLDFLICSGLILKVENNLVTSSKSTVVFIVLVVGSIILDFIWLDCYFKGYWDGPNKHNTLTIEMYRVVQYIEKYLLVVSIILLIIKFVSLAVLGLYFMKQKKNESKYHDDQDLESQHGGFNYI